MRTDKLLPLALLFAAAAMMSALVASADPTTDRQWQFDVLLDGKPIGYHTFELQRDGSGQVLETEARFDVKFLFITAFRYRHQNREVWENGCLTSIDAETNSNGKALEVRGEVADDGFNVMDTDGSLELPRCVQTFAYWNPSFLDSTKLLNSQTGEYENVAVTFEGRDQVQVAGEPVDALRYRLSAKGGDITLWYSSADSTWIGLEAPARGGRTIQYRAVAVPPPDKTAERLAKSD